GFGISTPAQAKEVGQLADGVVVGSALVRLVADHAGDPDLVELVRHAASRFAAALSRG
ncbi:MAG TPA: tryptophan synthase subunit alpha, partial [Thermoanaerobaculia bacterium]|nr:tryptophan synthase subunit alpha [Thermoanaerobaculia bacterium]